jgi:hypothetical protein
MQSERGNRLNQRVELFLCTSPEYTLSAWQAEIEGSVGLSVLVGVDGRAFTT